MTALVDMPPSQPPPSLLERLFTESAEELTRYFTRRHEGTETVRDLVQETFLQMARGVSAGKTPKCARGYLFGIARHLSHAAWRQRHEHRVLPFDEAAASEAEKCATAPASDDRIEAARETISALEPVQREILDLRFAQGLSYAEIAEALGIPLGTVRSRLHHAVAEVRHRLDLEPENGRG
ncbi:MAG: RNA polymerase sigma factor [Prosthecobacter sp.]